MLWETALKSVTQASAAQNGSAAPGTPGAQQPAAGSPLGFVQGLWNSYGPTALGALQQYAHAAQSTSAMAVNVPPSAAPASAATTGYDATPQRSQPVTPAAAADPAAPPFPEPKLY